MAQITVTLMPTVLTLREALDVYVKLVSSEMVSHVLLSNLVLHILIKDIGKGYTWCYTIIPCFAADIIEPFLPDFWHCHSYIFQHFDENIFKLVPLVIYLM